MIKPRLKSVWILPPASGAKDPFWQDQALDSLMPVVKKVNKFKRSYPSLISFDKDVSFNPIDNRRFTMRDIGQIAERVSRLEYYTSLSLLEKDAQQLQILDTAGLDRFKNGILVDNFTGHGVGEVINPDYKASIDPRKQIMRPSFAIESIDYIANTSGTSNVIRRPRDVLLKVNFTGANTTSLTFAETVSGSTSGTTGRLKYGTSANGDLLLLENETKKNKKLNLFVALNYGGKQDIIQAVKKSKNKTSSFEKYLFSKDLPEVDLLIRTGGYRRLSNFLLWQTSYTELYFTDVLWPDFSKKNFTKALDWYRSVHRKFGKS